MRVVILLLCSLVLAGTARADDWRAYHHGIDYAADGKGGFWVFYSGVKDPAPDVDDEAEWAHNIYVSNWKPGTAKLAPHLFIHEPGAQEPVSIAQTTDGHILLTAEDGGNTDNDVDQRYAVYKDDLTPIKKYPQQVSGGGHSGHAAAVGNRFVIFYAHEWEEGGGVDNLGSGFGVYAKIYDSNGKLLRSVGVAPRVREWWPMVAGSPRRALLVWQAFIKGQTYAHLKAAILDPATGSLTPVAVPDMKLKYYTYGVKYVSAINRFAVVATAANKHGFAFLVDEAGKVTARADCLPASMREAGMAVDGADLYAPVAESGLMRLHLTADSIALTGMMDATFSWAEEGSLALPLGPGKMHWASLDRYGIQEADFSATDAKQPTAQDLCR